MSVLTATLAVAATAAVVVAAPAAQDIFRSTVDSVQVEVAVRQQGRPITDLTAADFEVRDGGVVQHVSDVSREVVPIDVTFLLDMSGSVQGPLLESLTRAVASAGRRLRPTDRSEVIAFNHHIQQILPLADGGLPASFALGETRGQTSLLDALAVSLVAPPVSGRRHMAIVFTDGLDTSSFVDGSTVMELAKRSQTAVFAVALTGGSTRAPQRPAHEALFDALTATSGGTLAVLQRDQDLGGSFVRAFDDFRTSYLLRYTYDGPARAGWHPLTVRVTRRGTFDVRARQGYFSGG